MKMDSPYLDALDTSIIDLTAVVKATEKECDSAQAAINAAERASTNAPHDSMLRWILDDAKEAKAKWVQQHKSFAEQLKELKQDRQSAEAKLKGQGESALLCTGASALCNMETGHWFVMTAQYHMTVPHTSRVSHVRAAQMVSGCLWPSSALCRFIRSLEFVLSLQQMHLPPALVKHGRGAKAGKLLWMGVAQHIAHLCAEPLSHPCAGLTLLEAATWPISPLKQISVEGPSIKTLLTLPATCGPVLPWPEFTKGSDAIFARLDDTHRLYGRPKSSIIPRTQREAAAPEIRMHLSMFTESVNDIAEALSISVRVSGGGDARGIAHADMVMRFASAHSDRAGLSKEILGTVVVTSSSELQINRGERLEEALLDPQRREGLTALLQKVHSHCCISSRLLRSVDPKISIDSAVQCKGLLSRHLPGQGIVAFTTGN